MTQAIAEKEFCNACGVDVRPQADFCYNCGDAVSAVAADKKISASPAKGFSDEIPVSKTTAEKMPEIDAGAALEKVETASPEIEKKLNADEAAKLKSAASLRRKPKSLERKTVEVVWEEYDASAPNGWFISVAVLLTLLALGILFLAKYLR